MFVLPHVAAEYFSENLHRRIDIGIDILPNIIAVDSQLNKKLDQGDIAIAFVYDLHFNEALRQNKLLSKKTSSILDYRMSAKPLRLSGLKGYKNKITAIFISEPLPKNKLASLIRYAEEKNILLFSVIPGDVEGGVMSGLWIDSKVRIYLNTLALEKAKIKLHPLVIKMSKKHE